MKNITRFSVILIFALAGCEKSVLMKYAEPEARALCEADFYAKYHALASNDEKKEMGQIKNVADCQKFVNSFWEKRDTNPLTLENEFKIEMEKRIKFIEEEALFQHPDTPGIRFENNGGLWGDLAKVYMLHGTPDYMEVLQNGRTFVDLMIWVYLDESGQRHKYRFLFYHKNGVASFVLFRPLFDILLGLEEINKTPSLVHPIQVYGELEQRNAYLFLLALVYFSDEFSLDVDEALDPPKTASEIIQNEAPTIQGELPENKEELAYQSDFKSTVPAKLSIDMHTDANGSVIVANIEIKYSDLDWKKNSNGLLETNLKISLVAQNLDDKSDIVVEQKEFAVTIEKEKLEDPDYNSFIQMIYSPKNISGKKYKVSVFLQNTLTNKYNAWIEEVER